MICGVRGEFNGIRTALKHNLRKTHRRLTRASRYESC